MSQEIGNQISHIFNAMGSAILQTIILYFVAPFLVITLFSRFVLKIRGTILNIIMGVAAFGCFFFFAIKGLPEMQKIYSAILQK